MKKILRLLCLAVSVLFLSKEEALAQYEAMYSQYMFNGLVINPGYAGSTESLSAGALYRRQWLGIDGAPVTQSIFAHAPVAKKRVGVGGSLINDKIGETSNLNMNGIYSYRFLTKTGAFSVGLQTGLGRFYANYSAVQTSQQQLPDEAFKSVEDFLVFNFGAGAYYYSDKFYIGASVPFLTSQKIYGADNSFSFSPSNYRHYFLSGGYLFTLTNDVKLKPSTLIKVAAGAPVQVDLNTNAWFYNRLGVGVSYRTSKALVGLVEIQFARQLRFSYSYDLPLARSIGYAASHEIMIRFDRVLPATKFVSPRFF